MAKFKVGERVRPSSRSLKIGMNPATRAVVVRVRNTTMSVRRDDGQVREYANEFWEIDPLFVPGTVAWMEGRAMTHLIVRP